MFDYLPTSEEEYNAMRDEQLHRPDPYDAFGGYSYCDRCNTRFPAIGDCNCTYAEYESKAQREFVRDTYTMEYRELRKRAKNWRYHFMADMYSFNDGLEMSLEENNLDFIRRAAYVSYLASTKLSDLEWREINAHPTLPNRSYWYQDPSIVAELRRKRDTLSSSIPF
jgi:hypothetical protein